MDLVTFFLRQHAAVHASDVSGHVFPGQRIFITDEIIHNPFVNQRLTERGMQFLFGRYASGTRIVMACSRSTPEATSSSSTLSSIAESDPPF